MRLTLDLGNPTFLIDYWDNKKLQVFDISVNTNYIYGHLDKLDNNIRKLHEQEKNCKTKGKYIVVGNGATQILSGLMHVLTKYNKIYAHPPYFYKFPKIANINLLTWDKIHQDDSLQIITYPNNPDNSREFTPKSNNVLYDLTYNWSTYGETINFDEEICIFSLAKATGHASARIGWAVIEDKAIADALIAYIDVNSNGVSAYSQEIACFLLDDCVRYKENVFTYGKKELSRRWEIIKTLNLPFDVINTSGMFLWCKGICPKELISKKGSDFGVSDEYFRLNLGTIQDNIDKLKDLYGNCSTKENL